MSSSMVVKRRHRPMVTTARRGSRSPPRASAALRVIMATTMAWTRAPLRGIPADSHHRARWEAVSASSNALASWG